MSTQLIQPQKTTKVIIIGAGVAGLSACKTLIENGLDDFIVLEAQNYVGGRIKSEYTDTGVIEHGAQWLHGTENELYNLCKEHKLISDNLSIEGKGEFVTGDGNVIPCKLVDKVDNIVGNILYKCEIAKNSHKPNISVGEYLTKEFNKFVEAIENEAEAHKCNLIFNWHLKFQNIDNCCENLHQLSAKHWGDYDFNGDGEQSHINLLRGYSSVVNKILKFIPKDRIHLNKAVIKIKWYLEDSKFVQVFSDDGCVFLTQHVICTMPLGVLKAKQLELFSPTLPPSIKTAIDCLGFGDITKIFLEFESNWWGNNVGYQICWQNNTEEWRWYHELSGFDVIAVGTRNTLLGWVGPKGSSYLGAITDEKIGADCIDILAKVTCLKPSPLKRVSRSRWGCNPYVRGCYSHITVESEASGVHPSTLAQPVLGNDGIPRIMFAGEACHAEHFSTTHGAYESGRDQAAKIVAHYSLINSKCGK